MRAEIAKVKSVDILGNRPGQSDREIMTAILKRWRQTLGYCSIFAAVPGILGSHRSEARSNETKRPEVELTVPARSFFESLSMSCSNQALLKRQSEFLLPHQKVKFAMLTAMLAGNDDCPGLTIPGANYTDAAPFVDHGDTTGANNTVSRARSFFYCYYSYDFPGADHVYSFTLTSRRANPQIQISRTSGTYEPAVYILDSRLLNNMSLGCPAGTERETCGLIVWGRADPGGSTATIPRASMNVLPLNIPLYLFVDSVRNDARGFGPYTIRIQDVTIAPAVACSNPNPIDCVDVLVRQHYLDFLNREPDQAGYAAWQAVINGCAPGDTSCDRTHVSSSFFRSPEFQGRGYFVYRFYPVALGRKPDYDEFRPDLERVSGFLTEAQLEAAKLAFIAEFMSRPAFVAKFNGLTNTQYVDTLLSTAGITHPSRDSWIAALTNGSRTRAQVLREISETTEVYDKYYNQAFVVMQYFGYLRRQPDALYLNWIAHLDATGDSRSMINGFLNSIEYRARFGP